MKKGLQILFFLAKLLCINAQQYNVQWEYLVDGAGKMDETAYKLIADHEGNLYALGTSVNNGEQLFVSKYNSSGQFQWGKYYPESSSPKGILIFNNQIYVGCYAIGPSRHYESVVLAYDINGEVTAKYIARDPMNGDCKMNGFALDAKGNVYVAGRIGNYEDGTYDAIVVKFNTDKKEEWRLIHKGNSIKSEDDEYNNILVGADQHIYVSGDYFNQTTGSDAVLVKITPAGKVIFTQQYNLTDLHEQTYFLNYSASQNIFYQAGYTAKDRNWIFFINQYNTDGVLQWTRTYDHPGEHSLDAFGFDVDDEGNVYGTCKIYKISAADSVVLFKYDLMGNLKWLKSYTHADPVTESYNPGFQIKAGRNKVYLLCNHLEKTAENAALTVYDPDGNMISQFTYNSSHKLEDEFQSMVEDLEGNLYLLGYVKTGDKAYVGSMKLGIGGRDLLIMKLSPQR